jgi:fermentation-respiration switch protein FrsA (DUF1100 family)
MRCLHQFWPERCTYWLLADVHALGVFPGHRMAGWEFVVDINGFEESDGEVSGSLNSESYDPQFEIEPGVVPNGRPK